MYLNMLAKDEYFAGEDGIKGALNCHYCDVRRVTAFSVTLQPFAAKAGSPVMSVPMGQYPAGTEVARDAKNVLVDVAPGTL
jgi:amidase